MGWIRRLFGGHEDRKHVHDDDELIRENRQLDEEIRVAISDLKETARRFADPNWVPTKEEFAAAKAKRDAAHLRRKLRPPG